ncbi:hypothetical protein AB0758_49145 [Tolypothrix bouteillei VB521301_2]
MQQHLLFCNPCFNAIALIACQNGSICTSISHIPGEISKADRC